jgi:hypothetical protein
MATNMMNDTVEFYASWHEVMLSTYQRLIQLGLPSKEIMQLLSNWTHFLVKSLYQIRRHVYQASTSISPLKRLTRHLWYTMKVHEFMASVRELEFKNHPTMSNAFVSFLTVNLAKLTTPSDASLKKIVKALLDEEIKKIAVQVDSLSTQLKSVASQHRATADKVELIVKHHPELLKPKKPIKP